MAQSRNNGDRLLNTRTPFRTDYLPGYTGHIPYKKEIYGCTIGDINKIVTGKEISKATNFEVDESAGFILQQKAPTFGQRTLYSNPPTANGENLALRFGNVSRKGDNWIGGPTANSKAQHIPGYQGYVPSIKAENLYGQTFGKATAVSINKEYPKDPGVGKPPLGSGVDRYKTQAKADFAKDNFRRIMNQKKEPADGLVDEEFNGIQVGKPNIYMTIPTVGYQGFKSAYRPPTVATYHRKQPQFNMNPLRPRLPPTAQQSLGLLPAAHAHSQSALTGDAAPEKTVSNGFIRAVSASRQSDVGASGYTGHRMGYRAQGFFGKNFRDCTIQSRNIQKAFEGSHSQSQLETY